MKKVYLFLATMVAALSSCMEESALVPVTPENQVTIKAVAGETKTTLDGTAVIWENNDAIKLVLKGENYYTTEFITELDANSAEATFAGSLASDVTVEAYGEKGFAVYPSNVVVESDGQIEFEIPASQNGVVAQGSNLAYAEVSLVSLKEDDMTEATFHNALSLLKITVPQGVKSVKVTSGTPLVGTAPFYYDAAVLSINPEKWYDSDKGYSVTLANGEENLDHTKTHFVHVFPGEHESLTIDVEGEECSYSKTVEGPYDFEASKFYTLNIANIFSLSSNEFFVSPLGGDVEIPVVTTLDEYQVNIQADATWLTLKPAVKGAFRNDVLTFTATENASSASRSAIVTVTSGNQTISEFTVTQENYVPELLGEYLESYTKSGMQEKGTLKIELSDNLSEGLYKVTICGSVKYANYENGKLNIYDGKYTRSLTVLSDFSKLENSRFTLNSYTISNYVAIRPLGAPELTPAELAIVGVYNETWTHSKGTPAVNGMEISASEEAAYGNLYVKFLVTDNGGRFEGYATLNNNTLTVPVGEQSHSKFGMIWNPSEVITLTVNDNGTLTMPEWTDASGYKLTNYVATKVVEDGGDEPEDEPSGSVVKAEDLVGTWSETFLMNGSDEVAYDAMTISIVNGSLKVKMFNYITQWSSSILECSAELSSDGKTLTVKSSGCTYNYENFSSNFTLSVSADGTELSAPLVSWGYQSISNYKAAKK